MVEQMSAAIVSRVAKQYHGCTYQEYLRRLAAAGEPSEEPDPGELNDPTGESDEEVPPTGQDVETFTFSEPTRASSAPAAQQHDDETFEVNSPPPTRPPGEKSTRSDASEAYPDTSQRLSFQTLGMNRASASLVDPAAAPFMPPHLTPWGGSIQGAMKAAEAWRGSASVIDPAAKQAALAALLPLPAKVSKVNDSIPTCMMFVYFLL